MVEEAIAFYEVCIKLKGKLRSHNKIDMMKCYELLGLECLKAELVDSAAQWFNKATQICKRVYGESEQLADSFLN
jgi:hypothetical protein